MGLLRRGNGGGEAETKFQMRENLLSIGDDYWIEDYAGERVFKVDGKALRLRSTLILQNKEGQDLYRIHERMLRIRDTMEIERAGGGVAATISKTLISPLRNRRPGYGYPGKHTGPRVPDQRRAATGRRGLEEVVSGPGYLRRGGRSRAG